MSKPEVCILKTDGINCDVEMGHAFQIAGALTEIVHVNQLRSGERKLDDFAVLAIPGGFSYGDDIASGRVLANELTTHLSDDLKKFVEDEKPVLGVCNGFQVLVRTGLLPFGNIGDQQATLSENEIGRFECRWIDLAVGQTVCRFVDPADFEGQLIPMQTAHGEGRFFADDKQVQDLSDAGQVVFRYAKPDLNPAEGEFPFSPNGSLDDIAGVCDPKGVVLGMMPHPERSVAAFHPHRRRTEAARTSANIIFRNIVRYAKES